MVRQESERSCIISREAQPKHGLLRFVVSPDGVLVPDIAEKLPGRGMWLSASLPVLRKALDQRAFVKVAKQKLVVPEALETLIEKQLLHRVQHWLSLAVKSGELVTGFVKVESWLASKRVVLLLEASDGASDGKEKMKRLAAGVLCNQSLTRDELGEALGRADAVHVAVASGGIAEHLLRDLRRLAGFREQDSL